MKHFTHVIGSLLIAFNTINLSYAETITRAQAVLLPTQNNTAHGVVTYVQFADGVKITGTLSDLKPGPHGFHIHQWGDCSAPDASSAGAHFNPSDKQHGSPENAMHHAGDLGNITADANGNVHFEIVSKTVKLNGPNSVIGRSLILHADQDDLKTQPSGNSGGRIACGVIGVIPSNPEKSA